MGWNINWFRKRNVYLSSDELKCIVEDDTIFETIENDAILCTIQDDTLTGIVKEETIIGYVQNDQINQNIK